MDENTINQLADKFLKGTITESEFQQLEAWFAENDGAPLAVFTDENEDGLQQRIFSKIAERSDLQSVTAEARKRIWPRIAAAASIIFLLGFSGYFYFRQDAVPTKQMTEADIAPGKNLATLTLASGKKIILSDLVSGQIAKEAGVAIKKTASGQLVYTIADNDKSKVNQFNILSTAKGETFKVNLPDGTQVWLNAASSLTYPVKFTGLNRSVTLSGEGYFEVAKDKIHPFKVTTAKQEVTVLGTHFNINAYTNEMVTRTTLLEGSVKVTAEHQEMIIKPGQQVSYDQGQFKAVNVDPELATAWKNNNFVFDGCRINDIMRMVERWYNIDVIYSGPVSNEKFYGLISRYENVSEVLKVMEASNKIHFKIEGRKIIVSK